MRLNTALYLLTIIPALSGPLIAQKQPAKPPFTLVLTSAEPKFSLGADVWAKIVWTNTSTIALNDSLYRDTSSGRDYTYILDFRDSDGHHVATAPMPSTFSAEFGTLKPGDSMNDDINLNRIYHLDHPGDYTLQVSRRVPKELGGGVIKSNKITITILPPPVPH
ncbi:MAG: hypothetical protein ACRD51_07500 [Candidatus Acidiferrum sp.]